jgi:hypothetical protein
VVIGIGGLIIYAYNPAGQAPLPAGGESGMSQTPQPVPAPSVADDLGTCQKTSGDGRENYHRAFWDFCNNIGTRQTKQMQRACPQLAKADMRALTEDSGFDPKQKWNVQRSSRRDRLIGRCTP